MISTSDMRHVVCVWYVQGDGHDIMGVLYQKHDGTWVLPYRFRHYASTGDGNPHGNDDVKNWYLLEFNKGVDPGKKKLTVAEMEATFGSVLAQAISPEYKVEKVEVRGNANKFAEIMLQQKWAHAKFEPSVKTAKA